MKWISLGGVGGCELARALRKYNHPAYPFDWNVTRQDFVCRVIMTRGKYYFNFENEKSHGIIAHPDRNALLLHDPKGEETITKYARRLERLLHVLDSNDEIWFFRIYSDARVPMKHQQYSDWFDKTHESLSIWIQFLHYLHDTYKKKIHLWLLCTSHDIVHTSIEISKSLQPFFHRIHIPTDKSMSSFLHVFQYLSDIPKEAVHDDSTPISIMEKIE